MYYAIIYNSDEPIFGEIGASKGLLLGYTEFPEDECFKDKPYLFVKVDNIDREPLKYVYNENGFKLIESNSSEL